jgi:hypothetical protein
LPKLRFSKAISLGDSCETAFQLRRLGLQSKAMFFDWLVTPANRVADIIESRLDLVLKQEHLQPEPEGKYVIDSLSGCLFLRHFEPGSEERISAEMIKEQFMTVRSKMDYLAERWIGTLSSAERQGDPLVFVLRGVIDAAAARDTCLALHRQFPALDFKLLVAQAMPIGTPLDIDDVIEGFVGLAPVGPHQWQGDDLAWNRLFDDKLGLAA